MKKAKQLAPPDSLPAKEFKSLMDRRDFLKKVTSTALVVSASGMVEMLPGCSGGGDGGGGGGGGNAGGNPVSGTVTDQQRQAACDSIDAKMQALTGSDIATARQALVDHIKTLPVVAEVGPTPHGVSGYFNDGRWFVIADNVDPGDAGNSGSAISLRRPEQVVRENMPTGKSARLMNGFVRSGLGGSNTLPLFPDDPNPKIAQMLEDQGYIPIMQEATIENYKGVGDVGEAILHIRTHGAIATTAKGDAYAIWSSTPKNSTTEKDYKTELDLGTIGYYKLKAHRGTEEGQYEWHLGITADFVTANWGRLDPHAFILFSACESANMLDPASNAFSGAVRAKGRPACIYYGWIDDGNVSDYDRAALLLFDRILGANTIDPKLTPPQRPTDLFQPLDEL